MPQHPAADRWNRLAHATNPSCDKRGWGALKADTYRRHSWSLQSAVAAVHGDAIELVASPTQRTPKMARLEAVLLVADGTLSTRKLAQLATLVDAAEAGQLIEDLNSAYDAVDSAFRIERVATGYQLLTRPQFARWLDKLHHRQSELKLSPPAMETLTIVAYRQPVTRADIEEVRGVQCTEMLKQLMDRNLVRIAGHDDSLGRPYLYGTTRNFLELFGLRTLKDLPMADQLRPKEPAAESDNESSDGDEESTDELAASLVGDLELDDDESEDDSRGLEDEYDEGEDFDDETEAA